MSETPDAFPVRVYFEDTDFSGNVYHAQYLKFLERARTEWLRARGVHHSGLVREGLVFAVRHMDISFDAAATIDDLLSVETQVAELSGARVTLVQVLKRGDKVLCRARVVVVLVNARGKPTRLPAALRALLRNDVPD